MGFLDELKKMTRPYDDDDEFFDDEDEAIPVAEEPAPARPAHSRNRCTAKDFVLY